LPAVSSWRARVKSLHQRMELSGMSPANPSPAALRAEVDARENCSSNSGQQ